MEFILVFRLSYNTFQRSFPVRGPVKNVKRVTIQNTYTTCMPKGGTLYTANGDVLLDRFTFLSPGTCVPLPRKKN